MRFIFFSDIHFEKWDWRNSVEEGIGGSETSHVEMAWRLAARGHEVICYAPVPFEGERTWRGTVWKNYEEADYSLKGTWIIYRNPNVLDNFNTIHPNQNIWFMAQDEWYTSFTDERVKKLDRFLALCQTHAKSCIRKCPSLKSKVCITSNGIKMDSIREITDPPERNPNRLMYASSPDRGLANLLKIFKKAREYNPDLELHAFYGFNNIDKLIDLYPQFSKYKKLKSEIEALMDQPNVTWHGRTSQEELYREWLKTGIWCYPTNFTETSCITCMEAQALGAIPITNPLWALSENVKHGIFIDGDATDPLNVARYVGEIVRLTTNPTLQEDIRKVMIKDIWFKFNWERFVDQWEAYIGGYEHRFFTCQYNFQLKHAKGKILNIGCDIDLPKFGEHGAVNLDILEVSPITKVPTKAHFITDARELPEQFHNKFDSVILGDILEHLCDDDVVRCLKGAKKALYNGGDIIVTCPNDGRPFNEQHSGEVKAYHEDECSFHVPFEYDRLEACVQRAGLAIKHYEELDYTFSRGHGAIIR